MKYSYQNIIKIRLVYKTKYTNQYVKDREAEYTRVKGKSALEE